MSTTTYICKTPIKFNGKRYAEEAAIKLDDEQAQPLLGAGAVAVPPAQTAKIAAGLAKDQK